MSDKGLDGKGEGGPKGIEPSASVDNKFARTDTPGGESKKGTHIHMEGPNAPGKKK